MSTPSEPTLTTDFEFPRGSGESKPSTTGADNVGKDQHDVLKSGPTVERDTAGDDSLQGSLNVKIASEDLHAPTSTCSSPTTNVVPGADLAVPEIVALSQGADDGDIWIPKGGPNHPNVSQQGQPAKPTRPKPNRDN